MKPIQPDLRFDEATHTYTWKGRVVPSVTQILSNVGVRVKTPYLDDDRVHSQHEWTPVGFDDRWLQDDTAAQFGSAFHKCAALTLEGKRFSLAAVDESESEMFEKYIAQFERFVSEAGITPKRDADNVPLIEYPLYSEKYKFCGTLDLAVDDSENRNTVIIYDWKTSVGHESFWPLQLAAYGQLATEVFGCYIRGTVVRFSHDRFKVFKDEYRERNTKAPWEAFHSCLNVYKMVMGG